jgi:hypothetical protein
MSHYWSRSGTSHEMGGCAAAFVSTDSCMQCTSSAGVSTAGCFGMLRASVQDGAMRSALPVWHCAGKQLEELLQT